MKQHQTIFVSPHNKEKYSSQQPIIPPPQASPKEIAQETQKFNNIINKSQQVLLRASTVFPFMFFPDTIIIDENKVSIIRMLFFYSSTVHEIPIANIQDVQMDTSLFFATLKILPIGFPSKWTSIHYLHKKDASAARKMIAGLMIGVKEKVDLSKVDSFSMQQKVLALGTVH